MNCWWPKRLSVCRWRCLSVFDTLEWRRPFYFVNAMSVENSIHSDPLWYKDAVFYEIYVRGFYDSNADGIGDFRGLTEKIDYLKWLGVDCLWLLPMYASPLRDGGYDISDYTDIHPDVGTLFSSILGTYLLTCCLITTGVLFSTMTRRFS